MMNNLTAYKLKTFVWLFALAVIPAAAQTKFTETFNVGDDVVVSVNTTHTNVIFETWNKDKVEVEAFVEGENLTNEEKAQLLKEWKFDVLGNSRKVMITSKPESNWNNGSITMSMDPFGNMNMDFLGPMLRDMPVMTGYSVPKLPEDVLENMSGFEFDYEEFKKDEEGYMKKFEKQMDKKFGKDFEKKMEKWGEEFEKQWNEKNQKQMEAAWENWGENFGKQMEQWGEQFGQNWEAWGENFGKDMEEWAKNMEEQYGGENGNFTKKVITDPNGNKTVIYQGSKVMGPTSPRKKGERTIIIRMPKNSKTDINVRHGEIKMADAYNVKATLNHTPFTANRIDGGETLINAAYAPVIVNDWETGTLYVKFVNNCSVKNVDNINLISNSSDVLIGRIDNSASLSGAFGRLRIAEIANDFDTVNIVLENTDAILSIPDTAFLVNFNGSRSTLKYPKSLELSSSKQGGRVLVTGFNKNQNSNKTIKVNATYSNVMMQ